jgi:ethanolamine ammonia-lyase large subunit
MDVSLDDLDWCLTQVMPANPAYLMALPTKIDPMLGYLTTGFQDHVRLREQFGYRVNDQVWRFFQELEIVDAAGRPGRNFGDPARLYLEYRRRKGDVEGDETILAEARRQMAAVRGRGVFLAEGHGRRPFDLNPAIEVETRRIYADAKQSIWAEYTTEFVAGVPDRVPLSSQSEDRSQYILHPETGERLSAASLGKIAELRRRHAGRYDVQIVVSDGLNALATMDRGQLDPYLEAVRAELDARGYRTAPEHIVLTSGRVRAGYRIGESLFAGLAGPRAVVHVIGERPGTGHRTFSVYLTAPTGEVWGVSGKVDHNITKVVSGIAITALSPRDGARESVRILSMMTSHSRS